MKDVESRRKVPAAVIAMICVSVIGLLQLLLVTGAYQVDSGTVRKIAPFLYNPFRKMMGEHPSTRPQTAESQASSRDLEIETVTGIKPEDLSIEIKTEGSVPAIEAPEEGKTIIPVSEPEKPAPLDSDEPVG